MQMHVLIVDDSATVRKNLLRSGRVAAPFDCRAVGSDAAATRAIATAAFDLILADVTTPLAGSQASAGPLRK